MTPCTCPPEVDGECGYCTARKDAREYAAEEIAPDYMCDARAADEWARRGA